MNLRPLILLTIKRRPGTKLAFIKTLNVSAAPFVLDFFHSYGGTVTDEKLARLRAHDNNISRYRRLLKTDLSDLEREFIERRLNEERSAMKSLANHRVSSGLDEDSPPA